ncbi:hypothetical protein BGZ73_000204 [Actinomortierella ambigua]|nr:hypothetical protein BGZ73_000204 [Actinomortierella ambigua]
MVVAKFCSGLQRLTCYGWHLRTHHIETLILELSHLQHFVLIGADPQATNLVSTVADIPSMLPDLKTFHLDGQFGFSNQFVHSLGRHGKRIESLKLSSPSLGMLGKGLIALTSLELFNCQNFTDDDISSLLQYCPKITSMSLADCSALTILSLKRILESHLRLECLDFRIAARVSVIRKHVGIAVPDKLYLRELFLHNVGLTSQHFTDILHASPDLRHIGLSRCFQLAERSFVGALQSLSSLKTLHLVECPLIGESALKQIADQHSETLSSLVVDTCGPMHIRSVVYIVKRCIQLGCLGVHGYQHITNSPFYHFSTEYQQECDHGHLSVAMPDAICSTTFELENLDKVIEYFDSPWPLEERAVVKGKDEGEDDTGSSFSGSATEGSGSDLVGMTPRSPPVADVEDIDSSAAFQFEYQSVASAYDLAKQVARTDIGTPTMLEGWAMDAVEDSELPEETPQATAHQMDPFSGPSSSFSASKANKRYIDPKGYSRSTPRKSFSVRKPTTPTPFSLSLPSSSLANQWQVYSLELQSSNTRHGAQRIDSTTHNTDDAEWMQGLSQDSANGSQFVTGQKTDLRGGWGERPRHPQKYTEEPNQRSGEQQLSTGPTAIRDEEEAPQTDVGTNLEATAASPSGWVDYSAWVQTTRGESMEHPTPSEHALQASPPQPIMTLTPGESTKGSLASSPSMDTADHGLEYSEPVLVDFSDTPVNQDAATGMGRAMEDMHVLGALYSHQPFQDAKSRFDLENTTSDKGTEGILVDLLTSDDEDSISASGPRHTVTANESRGAHPTSPLQGQADLDLLVSTVSFAQPVEVALPSPPADPISTEKPKPSDAQSPFYVASSAVSTAPATPKPSTIDPLEPCSPKQRDTFGFGLEDTMGWLQVLSERQRSG